MSRIPVYTIRTTLSGEAVLKDILLNGGSIPVNYDRLPVTEELYGDLEVEVRNRKDYLLSVDDDYIPSIFQREFEWDGAFEGEPELPMNEPLGALILIKGKCRSSLRCPMQKKFWQEWVDAGNKRSAETSSLKEDIRDRYPKEYDLSLSGAKIILPKSKGGNRDQRDKREYLVAIAQLGSFEWILDRSDGRPNAYRIDCDDNGEVTLIDPRAEIALEA